MQNDPISLTPICPNELSKYYGERRDPITGVWNHIVNLMKQKG